MQLSDSGEKILRSFHDGYYRMLSYRVVISEWEEFYITTKGYDAVNYLLRINDLSQEVRCYDSKTHVFYEVTNFSFTRNFGTYYTLCYGKYLISSVIFFIYPW